MHISALLFSVVLLASPAAFAEPAFAIDPVPNLDGTWDGIIRLDKDPPADVSAPATGIAVRLVIAGTIVHVFQGADKTKEVKAGKFSIAQVQSNAMISATDYSDFPGGMWTETWVFAVTPKDNNTLFAEYIRLVNNRADDEKQTEKFGMRGVGDFTRVTP